MAMSESVDGGGEGQQPVGIADRLLEILAQVVSPFTRPGRTAPHEHIVTTKSQIRSLMRDPNTDGLATASAGDSLMSVDSGPTMDGREHIVSVKDELRALTRDQGISSTVSIGSDVSSSDM